MTQDHSAAAPVCYRHPDRHTLLQCSRCGRRICAACSVDASVGQRCPECVRREGPQRIIRVRSSPGAVAAPATKTFIALAVGFYLLGALGSRDALYENLAQINAAVGEGEGWRIFTPVLLHSPGLMHIAFNMWALWVLGPQIERGVGPWAFVSLYLASAGVGGAVAYFAAPTSTGIVVGASGAIFGLFGVWFNWAVHRRKTLQGQALLRNIGLLLLINAAIPFLAPGIAWEAHLGGLAAGFAIGEAWSRTRGENAERQRAVIGVGVAALAAFSVLI